MTMFNDPVSSMAARVLVAGCALVFCASAMGASQNWWIDITNDRVERVKNELAMGEDPNVKSPDGQPAIMQAIQDQAWGVYDLLAGHRRIDVNITNKNNETPLMYLAIVGDVDRAKALVARGAEINRLGWTPLHYAASKGQVDMVRYLIANKALVDAPAPDGTTPLMMAAFSGSEATVRLLLDAGAEVTTRNLAKLDAADWARNKNFNSLADRLQTLIQDTVARRRAMAEKNAREAAQAAAINTPFASPASTVVVPSGGQGLVPSMPAPSRRVDAQPAPGRAASEPVLAEEPSQNNDSGGTSRYFDLERFERDN